MRRVIIFLKYPEPGQVKTRLAAEIQTGEPGQRAAARLARHFAEQTLAAARSLGLPVDIAFAPAERHADFLAWLGPEHHLAPQSGTDLGQRMRNAFEDAFARGAERVVLVGTDAPDRPKDFFAEALDRLNEHDMVLGPALDGGYHLIAMQRDCFVPEVFAGIEWSTRRVLAQTLDALRAAGRTAHVLPPWRDIDDRAGLDDYLRDHPEAALFLEDDRSQGAAPDSREAPCTTKG
jgi:rSAM/selenodomain-associated transferase 1